MLFFADKTMQFYKSSTVGGAASGRTTPAHGFSFDISRPGTAAGNGMPHSEHQQHAVKGSTRSGKDFWDVVVPEADGSIPESEFLPCLLFVHYGFGVRVISVFFIIMHILGSPGLVSLEPVNAFSNYYSYARFWERHTGPLSFWYLDQR